MRSSSSVEASVKSSEQNMRWWRQSKRAVYHKGPVLLSEKCGSENDGAKLIVQDMFSKTFPNVSDDSNKRDMLI